MSGEDITIKWLNSLDNSFYKFTPMTKTEKVQEITNKTLSFTYTRYMDTNAYGIMYIYMRRYGGMPNAVRKYTHGGKYHVQKYHHGDYPHGGT